MNSINRSPGGSDRIGGTSAARWRRWVAACAVAGLMALSISCDNNSGTASSQPTRKSRATPSTQPAVKPSVPGTQESSDLQPTLTAYLYFQYPQGGNPQGFEDDATAENAYGQPHAFPPARLRLKQRDDGLSGLLFSDDPKEAALSKDWAGHRFYFQFNLQQTPDFANVDGAEWWYQASAAEREESPNGVYLRGDRYHLEPTNVVIRLEGKLPNLTLRIAGHFNQYDTTDPTAKPVPVKIVGVLLPRVETKD
jgi:hypothetical protein